MKGSANCMSPHKHMYAHSLYSWHFGHLNFIRIISAALQTSPKVDSPIWTAVFNASILSSSFLLIMKFILQKEPCDLPLTMHSAIKALDDPINYPYADLSKANHQPLKDLIQPTLIMLAKKKNADRKNADRSCALQVLARFTRVKRFQDLFNDSLVDRILWHIEHSTTVPTKQKLLFIDSCLEILSNIRPYPRLDDMRLTRLITAVDRFQRPIMFGSDPVVTRMRSIFKPGSQLHFSIRLPPCNL